MLSWLKQTGISTTCCVYSVPVSVALCCRLLLVLQLKVAVQKMYLYIKVCFKVEAVCASPVLHFGPPSFALLFKDVAMIKAHWSFGWKIAGWRSTELFKRSNRICLDASGVDLASGVLATLLSSTLLAIGASARLHEQPAADVFMLCYWHKKAWLQHGSRSRTNIVYRSFFVLVLNEEVVEGIFRCWRIFISIHEVWYMCL